MSWERNYKFQLQDTSFGHNQLFYKGLRNYNELP